MQEVRRYDVDIDYCVNCKGVWLDRGEIDKISSRQSGYDEEHYRKYHEERDYDDYDDDYYRYGGHGRRRGFFGDLFDFWLDEHIRRSLLATSTEIRVD